MAKMFVLLEVNRRVTIGGTGAAPKSMVVVNPLQIEVQYDNSVSEVWSFQDAESSRDVGNVLSDSILFPEWFKRKIDELLPG